MVLEHSARQHMRGMVPHYNARKLECHVRWLLMPGKDTHLWQDTPLYLLLGMRHPAISAYFGPLLSGNAIAVTSSSSFTAAFTALVANASSAGCHEGSLSSECHVLRRFAFQGGGRRDASWEAGNSTKGACCCPVLSYLSMSTSSSLSASSSV